jgi:hypothetical protein
VGRDVVQVFEVVVQVVVQVGRASARSIADAGRGEREGRARQRDGRAAPDVGPDDSLVWGAKMAPIIKVRDGRITGLGWPPLDEYILNNQPNGHDDDNDDGGGGGGGGGGDCRGEDNDGGDDDDEGDDDEGDDDDGDDDDDVPRRPISPRPRARNNRRGTRPRGGGDETTTSLRRRGRGRRPRTIVETSSTTVGIGRAANGGVWGGDGRSGRRTTDVVSRAPPGTHCDDDAAAMTRVVRGTAVLLVVDEGGGGIDGDRAHGEGMAVRRPSRDRRRVGTRTTIERATGGERRGRGI